MKKIAALLFFVLLSNISSFAACDGTSNGCNHFIWGTEVGGSIDMSSNDMSTLNIDAFFGYGNSWIDALGIGASINMMVSNSNRAFPIYALMRTSFRSEPSLCFMDMRIGFVINNMDRRINQTRLYLSPGVGINLAKGKTFQSYIALSYVYNGLSEYENAGHHKDISGLHMACLRLGIRFR